MAGETVLIVEDQGPLARHLQEVLVALGYVVPVPLSTGESALAAAAAESPDIVLMDIGLAGEIDGIVAATEIHATYGIPIIFLTSHQDDSVLQRAKAAGPYGYLIKPVSDRELVVTLEMALHRYELDRQSRNGQGADPTGRWHDEELSVLSPREQEVFDLLVTGMPLKRIAATLRVSVQAVWKHEQSIFQKLGVDSVVGLVSRS